MDKIKLTIAGYNKIAKHWDGTRRHGWSEVNIYIDNILNSLKNKKGEPNTNKPKGLISVLDLGCGNARIIDFLKDKDYFKNIKYTGIDPSIELINICKNRYAAKKIDMLKKVNFLFLKSKAINKIDSNNIEFKINDGINIPLADSSIDVIISLAVLHHIPKDYQDMWLGEMHRVIKKNKDSKIILTVWIQDDKSYTKNTSNITPNYLEREHLENENSNNGTRTKESNTVHKRISNNEMMMGFAQYENIRYVYLFSESELKNLLTKNKFKILESHIDKRPNSEHKNLILILEPIY